MQLAHDLTDGLEAEFLQDAVYLRFDCSLGNEAFLGDLARIPALARKTAVGVRYFSVSVAPFISITAQE